MPTILDCNSLVFFCTSNVASMVSMVMSRVMLGLRSRVNEASICNLFTCYRIQA